jgi:hypothetical protein
MRLKKAETSSCRGFPSFIRDFGFEVSMGGIRPETGVRSCQLVA